MADETSSIALQLTVALRGLINLTKLNRELVSLKSNALAFQRNLSGGNNALAKTAKEAKSAATGLTNLAKANRDYARSQTATAGTPAIANAGVRRAIAADFAKQSREQARIHDRAMRQQEAATRRVIAMEQRRAINMKTLTGRLREYEEANDAIFRAGFRLQMLGNDMEAVGRKTVMALVDMSRQFGDFEFMVNRAAGATGILTTETDRGVNVYDKFKSQIQDAASELRLFDPAEVAKATYFWASTSGQQVDTLADLERAMRAVNPLMKIAAMTQTDYETAIKGVYSILVQYGLGIDNVQEVTEKLHMVTQRTAAEFPDLVNSFKMVGPVAKEFGVTFDDMVVLLGRLADAGVRGTMSGRAFRQFFIQISRPAPKATAALNALWESTDKFGDKSYLETVFPRGQFIGVNAYVDELAKRLQNATDKERMFTLATITTANELPVLTALVSKQIAQLKGLGGGWDSSKENMADAAAGFERSWSILRDSWNGTIGALTRGIEIIRIKVGERIAKIFTPILNTIIGKLGELREWFEDSANEGIIDFFVKVAGAAAGILAVGGSLTVLLGVLISLTAAVRVAFGAFAPLFGAFAKAGGIVGVFAVAAVRNFEYIKNVVVTAFNTIKDALDDTGADINDITDIFKGFAAVLTPVLDAAIWLFGQLILVVARVTAIVLKNEVAMGVLTVAAQVLGAVLAARLIFNLGKTVLGFNALAAAAKAVGPLLARTAVTIRAIDIAAGAQGGGLRGLGGALRNLLPALGPGGWLAVGLGGVALAFAVLYQNSSQFKGVVDRMVFEWMTSMDELIDKTHEVYEALGQFGPEARAAFDLDPHTKELKSQIEDLRRQTAAAASDNIIDIAERQNLHKLQLLEKQLEQYAADSYQTYADAVQQLRDLVGSDVTLEDYMSRLRLEANKLGTELDNVQAKANTWDFFRDLADDAKNADKQAAAVLRQLEDANKQMGGPSATYTNDDKARMLAQLADLQAMGKLSPQVASAVQQALTSGTQQGLVAWGEDPSGELGVDEVAKESFTQMGNDFVEAARGTMDMGKALREAMKTPTAKQQATALIKEFLKGPIAQGFRNSKGTLKPGAALLAQGVLEDTRNAFTTQMEGYNLINPATGKSFAKRYAASLRGSLKTLSEDVTPTMRTELAELFRTVYTAAGQPVPQDVLDKIFGKGKITAEEFNRGVTSPESVTGATVAGQTIAGAAEKGMEPGTQPGADGSRTGRDFLDGLKKWKKSISTTSDQIGNSTKKINKHGGSAYTWGSDLGKNFKAGLAGQAGAILGAATAIATSIYKVLHQSTADVGPLKDTDVWGLHLGQNIADGMDRSRSIVASSAMALARTAAGAYATTEDSLNSGISVESNANRVIKVLVEVTSPDGSVDRLKAAELERGLMTSDLVLSLEHMSTVG